MSVLRPLAIALMIALCADAAARSTYYVVFFDAGSTEIMPPAAKTLRSFADLLKRTDEKCPMQVTVTGHMDSAEAAGDDKAIDVGRAQAVIRELKRVGRESWTFVIVAQGTLRPLVPTPANTSERQNRRVTVDFADTRVPGTRQCEPWEVKPGLPPPPPPRCWAVLADGTKCEYP